MKEYAACIAIDWADKKHDCCLRASGSDKLEQFVIKHSARDIETWVLSLRKRFKGKQIAIVLEQSKGALVYALMKYDFIVLYPINPTTVAKYREAFSLSGAKDDPTDAKLILELFTKHYEKLKAWKTDTKETRMLQQLVEQRKILVEDRKRLGNRLTSLLKGYYPQILEIFPKMGRLVLCEFIIRYPTLELAQRASEKELLEFFRTHRSGHSSCLEKRIQIIRDAIPITTDEVIIETSELMAKSLAEQIKTIINSTQDFDLKIKEVFSQHQDSQIFNALPAAGEILAPRLLAALGTDRGRFKSASEIQQLVGIAPVIERSGQHTWIHWRYSCNKFIRQSFQEWAGVTIKHSLWARAFYAMQRQKGKSHPMAVRALAFKWIRIIYKLWKEKIIYSETTHIQMLQRQGSPIIRFLADNPNLEKLKFAEV